ncbi:reverse transcriptase zinc-binding domain-containing protein, partial [Tanacetum coccineum]
MGQNSEWVSSNSTLCQVTIPNLHQGKNDVVRWQSNDKNMVNFSVNRAWKDLSGQYEKVPWYNVVWFSNMIPRHAFIVWLLMLGRLPTQDMISKWHPNKDMKCTLCNEEMDSHHHLFFKCKYTEKVWNEAKIKCQVKERRNEWKCILEELIKMPNKRNIWIVIKKITFA